MTARGKQSARGCMWCESSAATTRKAKKAGSLALALCWPCAAKWDKSIKCQECGAEGTHSILCLDGSGRGGPNPLGQQMSESRCDTCADKEQRRAG